MITHHLQILTLAKSGGVFTIEDLMAEDMQRRLAGMGRHKGDSYINEPIKIVEYGT